MNTLAAWGTGEFLGQSVRTFSKIKVPLTAEASANIATDEESVPANPGAQNSARLTIPQGLSKEEFEEMSQKILDKVSGMSKDIVVQGSRAAGTASPNSDIDIAIKLNNKDFYKFLAERFQNVNTGSANEKTFIRAFQTGKIQAGEAGLSSLRRQLEKFLGKEVDISVIQEGGAFDNGAQISIAPNKTK